MEKPEKVLCINGPNLDLLGSRSPDIYGTATLEDLEEAVTEWGAQLGLEVTCRHSNHEGELVEWVHAGADYDGVVVNAGALTHYSWALADAVSSIDTPVVEVHLSNVRSRDRWRRRSLLTPVVVASLLGRGLQGYRHALRHLVNRAAWPMETARYGPHPDQVVDVRRASGATAAVLIHGGFWLDSWGRDTVETWAVDLARRGISSANVEYRRSGSGGSPVATRHDVDEAVRLARRLLGVTEVAVIGHSAGATLAVWHLLEGQSPHVVTVGVSGLYDLARGASLGEGAPGRFDPDRSLDLMDRPFPGGRLVLVHGDADDVVPAAQSIAYRDRLVGRGGSVRLEVVPGQGHFDPLASDSPAWEQVLAALAGVE